MNNMQQPVQIIDALLNSFNDTSAQLQSEQDSTDAPITKKQKTSHPTPSKMDLDTQDETKCDKTDNISSSNNALPHLTTRPSYPMPSPHPRHKTNLRQFDPSEFKGDEDDDEGDSKMIDLEASISSLPPLVASKSISDYNENAVYGWGCVDPLLYPAIHDQKQSDSQEDEIIGCRCIIPQSSIKFNFSDLSANFNGATLWQRDCNGLYGWGDNEDGSTGDGVGFQIKKPNDMRIFRDRPVRFISVGEKHTAVILQYGGLFVFGCNENGQCGLDGQKYFRVKPDLVVPYLKNAEMCQVVCGGSVTLALTRHGTLYSFGNEDMAGLLGRQNFVRWPSYQPSVIPSVYYQSVMEIAAGEKHCLLRTRYNRLFGWGRNNHGQLGVGDTETRMKPTEILAMKNKEMIQVECGGSHTAVLTKNGEIWCFGNNNHGQCAVDPQDIPQVLRPTQVEGKWEEDSITQIACGRYHTLSTDSQKVWTWGQNLQGQCTGDINDGTKLSTPCEVALKYNDNQDRIITQICGTNFSSLILTEPVGADHVARVRELNKLAAMDVPMSINFTQLKILCAQIENDENDITYLSSLLSTIFGSPSCLNQSFFSECNTYKNEYGTGIDFKQMELTYNRILNISPILTNRLVKSLLTLARRSLKYIEDMEEARNLRFYFLILVYPDIVNPGFNHSIMKQMNELIRRIKRNKPQIFQQLGEWISSWSLMTRMFLLNQLQECMSMYLEIKNKPDHYIAFLCDPIQLMYEANELITREQDKIPYRKFYNRTLTRSGYLDFKLDYNQWVRQAQAGQGQSDSFFSFCNYPFLLDPVAKRAVLQIEQERIKEAHSRPNMQQMFNVGMMGGLGRPFMYNPYFIIRVRRKHVLQDTINWIVRTAQNDANTFYKDLRVVFDNEEGVDQGGVRKEFFQLIIRECFDVKYGTFVYNEETRCYWFNQNALEQPQEYMLLGIIIGLAIYNGVLLDIHFPAVVYKKMCGETLHRNDLKAYDPMIYKSIQQMMEYQGDVQDLCLTFSVDYMKWDKLETHDLIENGRNIEVRNETKDEYIEMLTNYYLTGSIKLQFDAFLKGFKLVLKGKAFDMITNGEELELLICGNQTLDFDALEVACKYEGGYNDDHEVIRWFWDILHSFNHQEKKQFLKFFSGSDRAPLRGLGKLGMLVQKATGDNYNGQQLPTAHTCFNALLLPAYGSKELMRQKLLAAIRYSEGFGLK
eukprot:36526_1